MGVQSGLRSVTRLDDRPGKLVMRPAAQRLDEATLRPHHEPQRLGQLVGDLARPDKTSLVRVRASH